MVKKKQLIIQLMYISFILLFMVVPIWADTKVSEKIITNTTWTKAGSPYTVTETVEVAEEVTLNVESGVKVLFNENAGLIVSGQLIAIGTQEETIDFTSSKEAPSPADWDGIVFKDSSTDASTDSEYCYQSGSILKYCTIEHAGPAITCEFSAPFIAHCTITNNSTEGSGGGIYISGDAVVINNIITNNKTTSVFGNGGGIYSIGSSVYIANNTIDGNYAFSNGGGIFASGNTTIKNNIIINNSANGCGGGFYIYYGSHTVEKNSVTSNSTDGSGGGIYNHYGEITIEGNNISNNSAGLYGGGICILGNSVVIDSNSITNNSTDDNLGGGIYYATKSIIDYGPLMVSTNNIHSNKGYDIYNNTKLEISAENNYWGVTDTSVIDEHIFDMSDDIVLGMVSYEPIATQPHTLDNLFAFPSSHDFGSVNIESKATHTFTIFNMDTKDHTIGTLSVTGTSASEFAIQDDNCSGHTITPPGNCTVDVVFSPTSTGIKEATLSIPINDTNTTKLDVEISGKGTLEVCPAEKIYGDSSKQTKLLRYLRDNVLSQSPEGQEIIRLYYEWSPVIVQEMEEDEEFKGELKERIDGVLEFIEGGAK